MDINKLSEERILMAQEAEKEKETLACINKEIKKRKDYIRSLHLLEESRYDNSQARKQYSGLLRILKKYQVDLEQTSERFQQMTRAIQLILQPGTGIRAEGRRQSSGSHGTFRRQSHLFAESPSEIRQPGHRT